MKNNIDIIQTPKTTYSAYTLTPAAPETSPVQETSDYEIKSIYDGEVAFPNNYNAVIKEMMEDPDFEQEFEEAELKADIQDLTRKIRHAADKIGRKALFDSMLDDEGIPLKGFDLGAVVQAGINENFPPELLEKLISKTKSQHGALFLNNFCDEDSTALFGVEEISNDRNNENKFTIKTELFSPKGLIQQSYDDYEGPYVHSRFNNGKNYTVTKYANEDMKMVQRPLDYKIGLTYGNKPGVLKSGCYLLPSAIMPGAYNEYQYDFKKINGKTNILNSIKTNEIKPSKTLSEVQKMPDGTVVYTQNYTKGNLTTSRRYAKSPNGSTEHTYKITDNKGRVVYETERSFVRNADGTATSTIDGKKYQISYDDEKRFITMKSDEGERVINVEDKIGNIINYYKDALLLPDEQVDSIIRFKTYTEDENVNSEEEKEILWNKAKLLPADLLIELDRSVVYWALNDNDDSYYFRGMLSTRKNADIGVVAHELGHSVETRNRLKEDKEILNTFYQEKLDFIKTHSGEEAMTMVYFFNNDNEHSSDKEHTGGIEEAIAEVCCLLNAPGIEDENISIRSKYLIQEFPKTVSAIAKKYKECMTKAPLE